MPTPIPIISGALLTGTIATYFTVPVTTPAADQRVRAVQLTSIRLVNTDTVDRTVTLHIVPNGGTASSSNMRFKAELIPAGESLMYEIDDVMLPNESIQAYADATGVVNISSNGIVNP
jgi:hypothetical protein